MSKLKAERDDERDCFNKKEMYKALEELKCIGLNYFDELKNKRPNLKLRYLCLCQGAALYYANLIDPKINPEYPGVKDFDVWLFVSGYNRNYSSRKPKNKDIKVHDKHKRVDLLIYNSESLKNRSINLIKVLQKDCRRKTARCLLDKAIIELSPDNKILHVNRGYCNKNKKC